MRPKARPAFSRPEQRTPVVVGEKQKSRGPGRPLNDCLLQAASALLAGLHGKSKGTNATMADQWDRGRSHLWISREVQYLRDFGTFNQLLCR